ncbi:MAG: TlpA disulfide reductase family protein [bacterium]
MKLRKWILVGVILLAAVSFISLYPYTLSAKMKKVEEEKYRGLFPSLGIQNVSPPTKAKDFILENLEGYPVSLKDFQGKVVFLNFWATWCGPCRYEMPAMEKLWQKFKEEGFVILAVDLREGKEKVSSFMKENGYTFPALLDPRGKVASTYGIRAIPTTFLLDPEGKIVGKALGARNWASQDAFKLIEHLLPKTEAQKRKGWPRKFSSHAFIGLL